MISNNPRQILLLCSGVGHVRRGFETFAVELTEAFRDNTRWRITLGFGGSSSEVLERIQRASIECLPLSVPSRQTWINRSVARIIGRSPYFVEQAATVARALRHLPRFDIIMTSDGSIANLLWHWRKYSHQSYRILFSNGAPFPPPYPKSDVVHHLSQWSSSDALKSGLPKQEHFVVPYGFQTNVIPYCTTDAMRHHRDGQLRVAFIGALGHNHKRLPYLLQELHTLPHAHLTIMGQPELGSEEVLALATSLLGSRCTVLQSVPQSEMFRMLRETDLLILPSLQEGFGRVIVEAALVGIPSLIHDSEMNRELFGDMAELVDMSIDGAVTSILGRWPLVALRGEALQRKAEDRYSWRSLIPRYEEMFVRTINSVTHEVK